MSYKKFLFTLISGFIALLLFNMAFEVAAQTLPTPTPAPYWACPAGQYGIPGEGCVDADPGHYVPVPNLQEQYACDPGNYQPASGAVSCIPAGPGHYVPTTAAVEQTACPPGYYQPASGAVTCFPADPGHYVDANGSAIQTKCAVGTYQPFAGSASCLLADPGYFVDTTGATEQTMCPVGYTSEAGAAECTPIGYTFTGFFQPVDMSALNVVKAGQAIPIKFSLDGDHGLGIMAAGYPASAPITCDNNAPLDAIAETVSAGSSSLSYNPDTDQYTYVWKTNKSWANTCRTLTIMLDDGSVHQANFKFSR